MTTAGGFQYQVGRKSDKERRHAYFLSVDVIKPFENKVFAEFEFENPAGSKAAPLRVERQIETVDKKLSVESAPVKGVQTSHIYTVALRVYADSEKTRLLTEHIQKIQGPTEFQNQWVVALSKGFSPRKCEGVRATILAPPGWFLKEAGNEDSAACFLTKEEIAGPQGRYLTGVTIQRFKNLRSEDGKELQPQNIAGIGLKALMEKQKVIRVVANSEGPLPGYEIEYLARSTTPPTHIFQVWRSEAPGSATLIMAEAPAARWRTDWEVLEPIIRTIDVDPYQ
ncbi:hypothetical protein [Methylocystis parvus]|uniref:hypothetical protein n=1 Tax=Methylocystis parvus TaxID=134 RepID=UPI003C77DB6B